MVRGLSQCGCTTMIAEFILLLLVAGPGLCSNTHYVTPDRNTLCPGQPCLTFSQYVQQSDRYFTSNTTFIFLAGDHSLSIDLVLENVTNITLTGDNSSLPQITSKINCLRSVNVEFDTVSGIKVSALAFSFCGEENSTNGAIQLTDARDFSLSDCILHDNAFTALSAHHSSLTLINVTFANNSQSALRISSSTVTSIHDNTFSNNSGDQGGAAAIFNSAINFTGITVFESNSGINGSSLYLEGTTASFTGINLFRNGYANNSGGVLYATSACLVFEGETSFISNSAVNGGSVYLEGSSANFTGINLFGHSHASGRTRRYGSKRILGGGGVFYVTTAHLDFEGEIRFVGNSASDGDGGGIVAGFSSVISFHGNCSFINNSADYGGGIKVYNGIVNFIGNSSFINNSADGGGGINVYSGTMKFVGNSAFINNSAYRGGGINVYWGTMKFVGNSAFINNSADGGGGGIGAYNGATMKFVGNSAFINNSDGGGIFVYKGTMQFIGNSTFINNSVGLSNKGGGINANNGTVNCVGNSTFINNSAKYGGGISATKGAAMKFVGNSAFINNSAKYGGGISAYKSTMKFVGNSTFINNSADSRGGGIYVKYGTVNCVGNSTFINNSARYGGGSDTYNGIMNLIGNSIFINNSADSMGGGIDAYKLSTVTIVGNSTFINNSADLGGGISAYNGTIVIVGNSTFINNSADRGGGINAYNGTVNYDGNSSFINNSADRGGGIYAYSGTVNFHGNSSFINNSAIIGGGIYAYNGIVDFNGNCTCTFINNLATIDGGGITSIKATMNFGGNCWFINNSASYGGGIMIITASMNFYGAYSFINNSATYGGGIALDTSTYYLFQEYGSRLNFTGNHAKRGGAINVFDSLHNLFKYCQIDDDTTIKTDCFFRINPFDPSSHSLNISLIFKDNSASEGGDHLYGGTIDHCGSVDLFKKIHPTDLIETLASGLSENKLSDISSDPIKVCICDITDHPDCDRNINVTTYPGESFKVTTVAVGQRDGTVVAVIQSIFDKESTANLKAEENLQNSNKTCTTLTYTVFSNTTSERIELFAEGPCGPGIGQPLSITVQLQPCPDGFELSPTTRACICEKRLRTYAKSCDINNQTIFRGDHSEFWVGYDNETRGLILHPHCPFDYCKSVPVSFPLNDIDVQCNYNRSGLLCGQCQADLSLVLGTSRCLECSNHFLALLAAFALAGLLLVFFLLICRLTVAVGTISGLIFYANIVAVNQTIFFPQDPDLCIRILNVFIAWLNLDLGIESCYYNGMDAYAKTWLQFAFPIYIWVLVGLVIVSSKYSPLIARILGTNPVAVLATLFLLSYAKILRTILDALSFTNLQYPNGIQTVWLYDGNVPYFGGRHIPLFITAIVVLFALFLPYTLLLLLGHASKQDPTGEF